MKSEFVKNSLSLSLITYPMNIIYGTCWKLGQYLTKCILLYLWQALRDLLCQLHVVEERDVVEADAWELVFWKVLLQFRLWHIGDQEDLAVVSKMISTVNSDFVRSLFGVKLLFPLFILHVLVHLGSCKEEGFLDLLDLLCDHLVNLGEPIAGKYHESIVF